MVVAIFRQVLSSGEEELYIDFQICMMLLLHYNSLKYYNYKI